VLPHLREISDVVRVAPLGFRHGSVREFEGHRALLAIVFSRKEESPRRVKEKLAELRCALRWAYLDARRADLRSEK